MVERQPKYKINKWAAIGSTPISTNAGPPNTAKIKYAADVGNPIPIIKETIIVITKAIPTTPPDIDTINPDIFKPNPVIETIPIIIPAQAQAAVTVNVDLSAEYEASDKNLK